MDNKIENKFDWKEKFVSLYKKNKLALYLLSASLLITVFLFLFLKINNEKKKSLISEKYIVAGLFLADGNKEKSKELYEEIIFSKNKFYSILSLNTILEENLVLNNKKILEYFNLLEKLNLSKEQNDLIILKKALYLIKISNLEEGNILLKNLIDKDSKIKSLAEEILNR